VTAANTGSTGVPMQMICNLLPLLFSTFLRAESRLENPTSIRSFLLWYVHERMLA
jgi:hypothetical protein